MRIRVTFAKKGPLRYIGQIDLHKLWERAARRADLPLLYSQGFHPQPKLNLAAALPLGFSSRCEIVDMRLVDEIEFEGLIQRLRDTLPTGIQILSIERVEEFAPALQTQIVSAEYEVVFTEPIEWAELDQNIQSMLATAELPRERRGKTYDLRPLIEEVALTENLPDAPPKLWMRLAAREGATGRPDEVLSTLGILPETTRIERTRLIFQP